MKTLPEHYTNLHEILLFEILDHSNKLTNKEIVPKLRYISGIVNRSDAYFALRVTELVQDGYVISELVPNNPYKQKCFFLSPDFNPSEYDRSQFNLKKVSSDKNNPIEVAKYVIQTPTRTLTLSQVEKLVSLHDRLGLNKRDISDLEGIQFSVDETTFSAMEIKTELNNISLIARQLRIMLEK